MNRLDAIAKNSEQKDVVFQYDDHRWITLKKIFDGARLYKVLVTADERIGKVDNELRNRVKQELEKRHPGYVGVAIVYQ